MTYYLTHRHTASKPSTLYVPLFLPLIPPTADTGRLLPRSQDTFYLMGDCEERSKKEVVKEMDAQRDRVGQVGWRE